MKRLSIISILVLLPNLSFADLDPNTQMSSQVHTEASAECNTGQNAHSGYCGPKANTTKHSLPDSDTTALALFNGKPVPLPSATSQSGDRK